MISVRFVKDCDAIPAPLWQACFPPPREGLWWYRALQNCGIEQQFTFLYGIIENCQGAVATPVGIAPCFITDVPLELVVPEAVMAAIRPLSKILPRLAYQRTFFIGSPCADEGGIGLLPQMDRQSVLLALQDAARIEARRHHAPMLVWKDLPQSEKAVMSWLCRQRGLFALPSYPNTVAALPGNGKEAYFAAQKGSRRHQLKKKLRLSAERVAVTTEVIQNPPTAVMDEIFDLFWQTYEQSDIKFERLNRRFFDLLASEEPVHFVLLRESQSQKLIAFMMCFALGDVVINKFVGFDYSRPKEWFLYFRLWEAALDWCLSRGAKTLQSGQTCYAPKIEQGHALVPLFNYGHHANPVMHWIYSRVAGSIGWDTLDEDLARYLKAHPEEAPNSRP